MEIIDLVGANDSSIRIGMAIADISTNTTYESALAAPKLNALRKSLGAEELEKLVVVVIKQFCDSVNVSNTMNALQIIECAKVYIMTFPNNSVKDLIMCLGNAKKGDYGQIYNRVDQQVIFDFLGKYEDERARYQEYKHQQSKVQEHSNQLGLLANLPDELKESFKAIGQEKEPSPPVVNSVPSMEKFLQGAQELLSTSTQEEIEEMRRQAIEKNFPPLIKLIDDYKA